ncbi:MAG: nitroreductase family protein [Gemmatimonadetes bacterium]|nr:nitroreductase family protein [Gemmatimonadota bacterium]
MGSRGTGVSSRGLELGAVPVGAFDARAVQQVLGLPWEQEPLYLIPVGRPRG